MFIVRQIGYGLALNDSRFILVRTENALHPVEGVFFRVARAQMLKGWRITTFRVGKEWALLSVSILREGLPFISQGGLHL